MLLDAQLLTFMKAQPPLTSRAKVDQSVQDVMLGFVYSGLLLNIGATVSSLIITEMFGEMPLNAARADPETLHAQGRLSASTADLLARYGVSRGVRSITWHCERNSLNDWTSLKLLWFCFLLLSWCRVSEPFSRHPM